MLIRMCACGMIRLDGEPEWWTGAMRHDGVKCEPSSATFEIHRLRAEVKRWEQGVRDADAISQRERARAERAEGALTTLARFIADHPNAAFGMGHGPHSEWIALQALARASLFPPSEKPEFAP